MKKEIMRKYSLLGLVLIGASVVTAAVLPKKDTKKLVTGRLVATNTPTKVGQQTCVAGSGQACNVTANSASTVSGNTSVTAGGGSTVTTRNSVNPTAQTSLSPH